MNHKDNPADRFSEEIYVYIQHFHSSILSYVLHTYNRARTQMHSKTPLKYVLYWDRPSIHDIRTTCILYLIQEANKNINNKE